MRESKLLAFVLVLLAAWSQAQREPTYCGYYTASQIPVIQNHPYLIGSISPQVLTAEGQMNFWVEFNPGRGVVWEYQPYPVVRVEWRWDTFQLPGTVPGTSTSYTWKTNYNPQTGSIAYTMSLPITLEAQGTYRLMASGAYCYKPCANCSPVRQYLSLDQYGAAFIPQPNATMDRLLMLLNGEWRRNAQSTEVFVVAPNLDASLKSLLNQMATGAFVNCNAFGICDRIPPAKIQRFLTDVPNQFRTLVATGRLCGGVIPVCYEPQDSRVYDIGPKLGAFGVLIASGNRRDYIAFGPGLLTGGSFYLFEGPKGVGGMLREALLFALMEKQGREVR
ncbi:hypothetical protein [Fervidobacterium sp.]